ncbi:MAG TPA: hypothetical protein VFE29_06975 [Terriglobia bacterium]|nr:hypothetical protein [Terriglobia bacterium]
MCHLQRFLLSLAMLTVSCLAAGCSSTSSDSPTQPERTLAPAYEELGRAFGDRIVSRDYEGAYAFIAESSRADISFEEFVEAFKFYRESVGETPKLVISPGEPYQKNEPDPLLPDAVRDLVEDEFAIHLEPEGDDEGFSAIVWVLMENGQAKIGHFFVGD